MAGKQSLGSLDKTIQVVRRTLESARPGSAEPQHSYAVRLTTRASVKSKMGANSFSQIVIDGRAASHIFEIRFTTIPFDTRDRVRDVYGNMYRIISVENVDLSNKRLRIYAAEVGAEDVEAAL